MKSRQSEKLVVAGDKEVVKLVSKKDENIRLNKSLDKGEDQGAFSFWRVKKITKTNAMIAILSQLNVQFNSEGWTWEIARK